MSTDADPAPARLRLFVYDDLVYSRGQSARPVRFDGLLDHLAALLHAEPSVTVLAIPEQIELLARAPVARPFCVALAVGRAGERVARALHERTGWLPDIRTVTLARIELAPGDYRMADPTDAAVVVRLSAITDGPLALVDDTIYSGLTLLAILDRLPPALLRQTEVFCLQAIAQTLPLLRARCPVHAGSELAGVPEREVSIIKASHLFERGAIRLADGHELAFFERQEWMRNWFPQHVASITAVCAELAALHAPG